MSNIKAGEEHLNKWYNFRRSNPEVLILYAIALMTLLGMVQPHSGPSKYVFWLILVPAVVWTLVSRKGFSRLWSSIAMRWALGLVLLYSFSLSWSIYSTKEIMESVATRSLETLIFVMGCYFAFQVKKEQRNIFAKFIIISCVIGSFLTMVVFYFGHPLSERLLNKGSYLLDYPTLAPMVLLGSLIVALLFMEYAQSQHRKAYLLFGFIAVGLFIFMTQSRGPLISFSLLALLVGIYYIGIKNTIIIFASVILIAVVIVLATHSLDKAWSAHMATGLNGRIVIWQQTMHAFLSKPLLGYGGASVFLGSPASLAAAEIIGHPVRHPHSLFISMLYYFGLLGAVVWLGFVATVIRGLWLNRTKKTYLGFAAMLCLLMMTATDTNTLISEVGKPWWMWWVPAIAIASLAQPATMRE